MIQADPVPAELVEIHTHITESLADVTKLIAEHDTLLKKSAEMEAGVIVRTHEPLYKAKEVLVQLVHDITSDDTQDGLVAKHSDHPYAWLVGHALIKICAVAANVVLLASETSEAYRWVLAGRRLLDAMQSKRRCFLTKDEMKSVVPKTIAKYTPAPPPVFPDMESPDTANVSGPLYMELLSMDALIWASWTEPDNVRMVAKAAEQLMRRLRGEKGGDLPATSPAASPTTSTPATSPTTTAASSMQNKQAQEQTLVSKVIEQADTENAAREKALEVERLQQHANVQLKLVQRKVAKLGSGEKVVVFTPPAWAADYFKNKLFVATSKTLWTRGEVDNVDGYAELRLLDIITCVVQSFKGNSNNPVSCYYSHLALQMRLPLCLAAPAAVGTGDCCSGAAANQLDEWIGLCLSLAEFYYDERDLSHVSHCIDVVEALMQHRGGMADATSSISTYKGYTTSNGIMLQLLRTRHMAMQLRLFVDSLEAAAAVENNGDTTIKEDTKVTVQLFQNELLLPEEFNNASASSSSSGADGGNLPKPPNWTSRFVDTTRRINLLAKCNDPALLGMVDPPAVNVKDLTGKQLKQLAQEQLVRFHETIIPRLHAALNVDEDCERFILSRRASSDFYGAIFTILKSAVVAERRLQVLTELRTAALHENVFRNVLRQAEFEHATQSLRLAELIPEESRGKYYASANDSLTTFTKAFESEMHACEREKIECTLEGSDFTAYGLGTMRKVEVLLKLKRMDDAVAAAKGLIEFATKYAKQGGDNLAEMKSIALGLMTALGQKDDGAAAVAAAVTKAQNAKRRHQDPTSKKR